MAVDRQGHLPGAIGSPHPWALDPDPAAPEGDLTALVAVAHGGPGAVVTALLADDLSDLLLHQLGEDAQPDADRQGQKALLRRRPPAPQAPPARVAEAGAPDA